MCDVKGAVLFFVKWVSVFEPPLLHGYFVLLCFSLLNGLASLVKSCGQMFQDLFRVSVPSCAPLPFSVFTPALCSSLLCFTAFCLWDLLHCTSEFVMRELCSGKGKAPCCSSPPAVLGGATVRTTLYCSQCSDVSSSSVQSITEHSSDNVTCCVSLFPMPCPPVIQGGVLFMACHRFVAVGFHFLECSWGLLSLCLQG